MRVLHVVGALDPGVGGSTSAAFHTCGYLREEGVDAELAGSYGGPGDLEHIADVWPELPVHGFPRRPPHHYWHSPALRRWLKSAVSGYDLVLVHGVFKFPFIDAAEAARRTGVPYVIQPHGSLDPYDLRKHALLKRFYGPVVVRRLLSGSSGVIVTTDRERSCLITYGTQPRVDVVPLPVAGPSEPGHGSRFRDRFGIGADAQVVLFLSRLDRKKGLERLLTATARLRAERPHVVLVVVGAGDDPAYEAGLRRQADQLELGDGALWTGLLTGADKWDAFAGSDVFTLPSDYENFGIVVVEALLASVPAVISSGVYIAPELAAAAAALVCDRDVDSLASQLSAVLRDRQLAERLSVAGKRAAEDLYAPARVARHTIEAYETALASTSRT
jgi:glycosyltransferase involved in cell wall biosynthesis